MPRSQSFAAQAGLSQILLHCSVVPVSAAGGSTDTEETHLAWIKTPRKKGGLGNIKIPLIADTTKVCRPGLAQAAFEVPVQVSTDSR